MSSVRLASAIALLVGCTPSASVPRPTVRAAGASPTWTLDSYIEGYLEQCTGPRPGFAERLGERCALVNCGTGPNLDARLVGEGLEVDARDWFVHDDATSVEGPLLADLVDGAYLVTPRGGPTQLILSSCEVVGPFSCPVEVAFVDCGATLRCQDGTLLGTIHQGGWETGETCESKGAGPPRKPSARLGAAPLSGTSSPLLPPAEGVR